MPQRVPVASPGDMLQKATRLTRGDPYDPTLHPEILSQLIGGTLGDEEAIDPVLKFLGKPISELLGRVFKLRSGAAGESGLPQKLAITNWDSKAGNILLHGASRDAAPMNVSPAQLDDLLHRGAMDVDQPPAAAVSATRRKLDAVLPDFKSEQYAKYLKKHVKPASE